MPLIKLNATQGLTGTLPAVSGANLTNLDAGKVLQVVQTVKTDAFSSSTSGSAVDVTGLSVNITPSSSSNKIFVMLQMNNVSSSTNGGPGVYTKILRDSTVLTSSSAGGAADTYDSFCGGVGGGMSDNLRCRDKHHLNFLDSPNTTSQVTYKCQIITGASTTMYVNRWGTNSDVASVSTITAMEISA
tara:strand:+ start:121 stop:681 length:561 start_codon:yes stop_codon:yes gene_type:complete